MSNDSTTLAAVLIVGAIIATPFVVGGGGGRYDDRQEDAQEAEVTEFSGCTEDCSGHQAGNDWAEENGITDPDACSGNSESFIEGCRQHAAQEGRDSLEEAEPEEEYLHQ